MGKKIIVLSGSEKADGEYIRIFVNRDYIRAVEAVGGLPVVAPPTEDEEDARRYIDMADALILTGGHDIDPYYYNEDILPECNLPSRRRDVFEMNLLKYALKKKLPVLGICRGIQLINVYMGGTLYQDVIYNRDSKLMHYQPGDKGIPVHRVILEKESTLYKLYGGEIRVNSFHHQQIKDIGKGLRVTGRAPDGVIEVIEGESDEMLLMGLQWHPEMMYDAGIEDMVKIFRLLIK